MYPTDTLHFNRGCIWLVDGQGEQHELPQHLSASSISGSLYQVMAGRNVDHYCMCIQTHELNTRVETI